MTNMNELKLNELAYIDGGDSIDAFTVYADYVDTLYAKYQCKGKASLLVSHLVEAGDLSEDDLRQILGVLNGKKGNRQ